jgi:hypothetical protein
MRDAMLQASSDLDLKKAGGRAVRYNNPEADYRRTVYMIVDRYDQATVPAMFDFANPDSHSPQRYVTTVPQQALFLMNSPFMKERALRIANRTPVKGSTLDSQSIQDLYHRVLRRDAGPIEIELAQRFVTDAEDLNQRTNAFIWKYGYGKVEETARGQHQLAGFTPMKHFGNTPQTKNRWFPTPTFPDKELGHLFLSGNSGHPGPNVASVMQWTSPFEKERLRFSGLLKRTSEKGNGIRGLLISSRKGVLANHLLKPVDAIDIQAEIDIEKGETISFIVDSENSTDSDGYTWIPKIERVGAEGSLSLITKSDTDFCGPDAWPLSRTKPQSPLSQLAHVLMMSNEFQFVD